MKRREIIKYTALLTGAAVSAPLAGTLLSGCQAPAVEEGSVALSFFKQDEFNLVKNLADLILPRTDSPSASDVGVPEMIDHMVGKVYNQQNKDGYKNQFSKLLAYLDKVNFTTLDAPKKLDLLKELDLSVDESIADAQKAFLGFKQQTIAYYLSTEEIGTKFLNYLPVPGEYEACITLEEVGGKAWAL